MIILYVVDQQCSCRFYKSVLDKKPILDVSGMKEFELNEKTLLGLMPESGIEKILGNKVPAPASGKGIPRCELYISVTDVQKAFENLLKNGGTEISPPEMRNWGYFAAYGTDPDGHVITFAKLK